MTATMEIIERIRARYGVTYYGAAKLLGILYSGMQRYRKGGGMDDMVAIRAAALLDEDPKALIFALHAERAADPESKAFWQSAKQSVAATTLFALAVVLWATFSGDSVASDQMHPVFIPGQAVESLCIMFNRCRAAILKAFNRLPGLGALPA